jgi:heme-degrading monooxygenase HmoA
MFVTVSRYLAKIGEEDAIIALHEDWERNQQSKATGYLSGELLRNIRNSREFIAIMRFESQEFAQSLANDPEHKAWSVRLTSLAEGIPTLSECTREWHSQARNLTNG